MTKITPEAALDIAFYCGDLDQTVTIREYFKALLTELWDKEEGFSGKYPFGNSGWQYDLQRPLALAGAVKAMISLYNEETRMYDPITSEEAQVYALQAEAEMDIDLEDHDAYEAFVFAMIAAL